MSAPGPPSSAPPWPVSLTANHVLPASKDVNVSELDTKLFNVLLFAGQVYYYLFSRALVVTSGNDGKHAPGSKHYLNQAVDLRTVELDSVQQNLFFTVLIYLSREHGCGIFDERLLLSGAHVHVEVMR